LGAGPLSVHTLKPTAFFCSDPSVGTEQIIRCFLSRWNIEVTFEELRVQLGFKTHREWSDRAIERTTPCLFGLFSVVVARAQTLHPKALPLRATSWYHKITRTLQVTKRCHAAVLAHLAV
jgi:hypothetical protein